MEDTSKQDILDAIGLFAEQVDCRFDHIESEIVGMKSEIVGIKAHMVTKSYLDDKLADLKGDMIAFIRREDAQLLAQLT